MQLAENTVVAGRFRLMTLIGRGGMGSVWRATHLGLDIPCAVKFIEGSMAQLPEAQARFEREAKAAAQLRSPHVVQILDHGICDGTPYIAMELLEGEDLGKRLANRGTLPPSELHAIVNQVCRALSKAHALKIVHRDLKPDNIFLVRDDDREIVKVLDFGIAKNTSGALGGDSNTKTGAMLGTPYYMSPEQAQGTKTVDSRSDLWSLAVICYQALTGRLPFESEALGDLLVKIIVAPVPTPSRSGQVPPGFDTWWQRAASREVSERFQSAKEFSDSLALVCGVSQVSGVIDRPQLRVSAQKTDSRPPPAGTTATQPPYAPFASLPNTSSGVASPAVPPTQVTTGAPISRTYAEASASIPKKSGAIAVVAALGALTLAVAITAVVLILHGRGGHTASASPVQSASAMPVASANASASPPAVAAAASEAPANPPDVPAATPAQTATAAVAAATTSKRHGSAPAAPSSHASAAPPKPAPKPASTIAF
jgi:serine/threonine protein kinase